MRRAPRTPAGIAAALRQALRVPLPALLLLLAFLTFLPAAGAAQQADGQALHLRASDDGDAEVEVPLTRHRGYATVPASALETVGFRLLPREGQWIATLEDLTFRLEAGSPLVAWEDGWIQLAFEPYVFGDELYVPLQLLTDVVPDRLPELFRADGARTLVLTARELWRGEPTGPSAPLPPARRRTSPPRDTAAPARPTEARPLVFLDPGHGGEDPGSVGPGGVREKDVALQLALKIRDELSVYPELEVVLTRDRDVFIPLWERGPMATRMRGDRPGIFVSIHANAVRDRSVRGVETYFLSEARTEHERRVAELENSAARFNPAGDRVPAPAEDLDFIISELRNLDYIHWSAELAEGIQDELSRVHPGPDRGVKQGPFAVITNALMPGILLEAGFISHPAEERALTDPAFQRETARAVARAIHDFFSRYPPGRGVSEAGGR
jgi:N-acetylmuramoyl-L-alanine amidase